MFNRAVGLGKLHPVFFLGDHLIAQVALAVLVKIVVGFVAAKVFFQIFERLFEFQVFRNLVHRSFDSFIELFATFFEYDAYVFYL